MEKEILDMWQSGLSKYKVAEIYRRKYNMNLKLVRSELKNRYASKLMTNYEALSIVEKIIYKYVMEDKR